MAAASELDAVRLERESAVEQPLAWENVEGAPVWVTGVPPTWSLRHRLHLVKLSSNTCTVVCLPPGEAVRVMAVDGTISNTDIAIWSSDGSGLFRREVPVVGSDQKSLIYVSGDTHPRLVKISRDCSPSGTVRLALFLTRRDIVPGLVAYDDPLLSCEHVHRLRCPGAADWREHLRVGPQVPASVKICGPMRLAVETRYVYPCHESAVRQTYWVNVALDGVPIRLLEVNTRADTLGCMDQALGYVTVGTAERAYLQIPAGEHHVELSSDSEMYVRFLRDTSDDYLLPGLNRPAGSAWTRTRHDQLAEPYSSWDIRTVYDGTALPVGPLGIQARLRLAHRVARDNEVRNGGLRATMDLRWQAALRGASDQVRLAAETLYHRNTMYRDVIPEQAPYRRQWYARFVTRNLRAPCERDVGWHLARQHINDMLGDVADGYFHEVGSNADLACLYRLPDQLGISQLRLVVDRRTVMNGQRLFVQLNDRPPVELQVFTPASELTAPSHAAIGDVALTSQYRLDPVSGGGTLSGTFGRSRLVGDLVPCGVVEIPLPAGIQWLRVWGDDCNCRPRLAVQYRTTRPYRLTESEYYAATCHVPQVDGQLFLQLFDELQQQRQYDWATSELRNHWIDLFRMIKSEAAHFYGSTRSPTRTELPINHLPAPDETIEEWRETAAQLARVGQWVAALEMWDLVSRELGEDQRGRVVLERVDALRNLGEHFLADRTLRSLFLHDPDPAVREDARRRLWDDYQSRQEWMLLRQLAVVAFLQSPNDVRLLDLAFALSELQQYDDAMALVLLVAPQSRDAELVARLSCHTQWWRTFDEALQQIPTPERRAFWQGHRAICWGDYEAASHQFRLAAESGRAEMDHLWHAEGILAGLRNNNYAVRSQAVLDWERWWREHPGRYSWTVAPGTVVRHGGGIALYHSARDLTMSNFYLMAPESPVELTVMGPTRLRFELRPLHDQSAQRAIDDWLLLKSNDSERMYSIRRNVAAEGLLIVGDDAFRPGVAETVTVTLPAGRHELLLRSERYAMAVRPEVERPEFPLSMLPPLTPATLQAVLEGRWGKMWTCPSVGEASVGVHVHGCGCAPCDVVGPVARQAYPGLGCRDEVAEAEASEELAEEVGGETDVIFAETDDEAAQATGEVDGPAYEVEAFVPATAEETVLAARMSWRMGCPTDEEIQLLLRWCMETRVEEAEEKIQVAGQYGYLPRFIRDWPASQQFLPTSHLRAMVLKHQGLNQAMLALARETEESLLLRAHLLLRQSEQSQERWPSCLSMAHQLVEGTYVSRRTLEVVSDIEGMGSWRRVEHMTSSAGTKRVAQARWWPESPGSRVRCSMLADLAQDERLIFGSLETVIAMQNVEAKELQLTLRLSQLGSLALVPTSVAIQLSAGKIKHVRLDGRRLAVRIPIEVPAGEHVLKVWIESPTVNQFVQLKILDTSSDVVTPLVEDQQKEYHVATVAEPVVVQATGPAWLRVDELRGSVTVSRYIDVLPGARRLELSPAEGQEQSLFRVFQFVWDTHPTSLLPAPPQVVDEPVHAHWLEEIYNNAEQPLSGTLGFDPQVPPHVLRGSQLRPWTMQDWDIPVAPANVIDAYPLRGQEDGTGSLGFGYFSRRPLDEGNDVAVPDRFAEVRWTHAYRDRWWDHWTRDELMVRPREESGPSFGWVHRRRFALDGRPWAVNLQSSLYLQRPSDALVPGAEQTEWSAALRGQWVQQFEIDETTHHLLSFSAFWRPLSQTGNGYQAGRVDQDIFTAFKANHRAGIVLSDRWTSRPWNDTVLWLQPSLMTTESMSLLDPDNVNMRFGWAQALGQLELETSYRLSWYLRTDDRSAARLQNVLYSAAYWDLSSGTRRRDLTMGIERDLDRGRNTAYITLSWYLDRGRTTRDQLPGQTFFADIRDRLSALKLAPLDAKE